MHYKARILPIVVLVLSLSVFLSACGFQDTRVYQGGRDFYNTFLNAPVRLNLNNPQTLAEADSRLVSRIMNVDVQLTSLERTLDAFSQLPSDAQTRDLFLRFPWLTSISVHNQQGDIIRQVPATPSKELDFAPLLEVAEGFMPRDLRYLVQDNPLGPEFMIAKPFTQGTQVLMYYVASFDMQNLLAYSTDASLLVVLTPALLLWSGKYNYAATPLAGTDWTAELKRTTNGVKSSGSQRMVWLVRYLGYYPIIFAAYSE